MKILIIDDDYVSRTKMKTILQNVGVCTDAEKAVSAVDTFEQALLDNHPFDLVTLDIHMPDMDGTEVLSRLRGIEKGKNIPENSRSKVIMVTAQSDKGNLLTCFQAGCNGFVVKPFTKETLLKKLEGLGFSVHSGGNDDKQKLQVVGDGGPKDKKMPSTREQLIQEVSAALKADTVSLPSLPDINTELKEMLQRGTNTKEIVLLLKKDMMIASSLISLSNSAIYRGVVPTKTLEDAINRIGVDQTFQHVEMICQKALYSNVLKKFNVYVENLWKHAQSCAYACQCISDQFKLGLGEDPFTMGLVHDIGKLILIQIIGKLEEAGIADKEGDENILYSTVETYHGEFGAALLKKWGFSDTFATIARYHNNPGLLSPIPRELALVSFSNVFVKHLNASPDELLKIPVVEVSARSIRIDARMIADVREIVQNTIKEMVVG